MASRYVCMECRQETPRDKLTVKQAVFKVIGKGGRVIRSRTTGFLCPPCLEQDDDWNRKPYDDAPGMAPVPDTEVT